MSSSRTSITNLLPLEFNLLSYTQLASLWSNYGHIYRLNLDSSSKQSDIPNTLILKAIHPPSSEDDPSESHLRKLLSYKVERWFYYHLAPRLLSSKAKVAQAYRTKLQLTSGNLDEDDGNLLLEDLTTEFPIPAHGSLGKEGTVCVLDWLAGYHGTFFAIQRHEKLELVPPPNEFRQGDRVKGVWQRGTYFYLETRRDEISYVDEDEYSWLMPWIEKVNTAIGEEKETWGTLLHGDVKGANILFNRSPYGSSHKFSKTATRNSPNTTLRAALYDFQYVGVGLPTLDLVYFMGTSIQSSLLSPSSELELLQHYHATLLEVINARSLPAENDPYPFETFLRHWDLAIVDWYRFMAGWGFWGNDRWVERRAKEIVKKWEDNPGIEP